MDKYIHIVAMLALIFFVSCNTETKTNIKEEISQKPSFVINETLSSSNYSDIDGYYYSKDGFVPTADIAFQIAEPVLMLIYGNETIEGEKPFSINLENDIWIIEGYLEKGYKGGVAYMEIRKSNGEILRVIHTK
jgi:hypothetical protein